MLLLVQHTKMLSSRYHGGILNLNSSSKCVTVDGSPPGVPLAGLHQVRDAVVLGVAGDKRGGAGRAVVGRHAAETRDLQGEADRAKARRGQALQDPQPPLQEAERNDTPGWETLF